MQVLQGRARITASINGFRVHPDPGDGGLRVAAGEAVVINAADIAAGTPGVTMYLIVNWGDEGNDRVGCGPCRLTHSYAPGRYTLTATADDLQPGTAKRSITLAVEVISSDAKRSTPFANFNFEPHDLNVGDTGSLFIPFPPPGVFFDRLIFNCTPFNTAFPGSFTLTPNGVTDSVIAFAPGYCKFEIFSHDTDGNSWHDVTELTVH